MKTALLFPGYGDQYVGMGEDFYKNSPIVKKFFKEANDHLNMNCEELCFKSIKVIPGLSSPDELDMIDKAYVTLYLVSCATYALLKYSVDLNISCVAGYDTGTYAAIQAAGGVSFIEGLYLLRNFSRFYTSMLKAKDEEFDILMVCGLTETKLSEFLDNRIAVAAYQSRTQHLLSGTRAGIQDIKEKLRRASGVTLYDLGIGLSLNSEIMNPVAEQLRAFLKQITIHNLQIPLISSINAQYLEKSDDVKEEMITITNKPIRWDYVIDQLKSADLIIGLGPSTTIVRLANETYPEKPVIAVKTMDDIENIKKILK